MRGTPRSPERWTEAVGLGGALGTALYTTTYFTLYVLGVPAGAAIAPALVVTVLALGAGGRALTVARAHDAPVQKGSPFVVLIGLGVVVGQMVVAAWIAVHSLLRHDDAWTVWGFKARLFALGGLPPGYFHYHVWSSHPDYPLNLPLVEAVFFRLPDPAGLTLASLSGVAALGAVLLLYEAGLTRLYGRSAGALGAALIALVPSVPRVAGYGYADVPLALYAGGAALYLALWWRFHRPADLTLCGALAGGAIWTKHEGLALAGLIVGASLLAEAARRRVSMGARLRHMRMVTVATLALPLPWLLFVWVERPVGSDFLPLTLAVFLRNAGRFPQTVSLFAQEAVQVERWSLFWPLLALAVVVAARRLRPQGWALLLLLLAQLSLYLCSYIFSDWVPFTLHVDSSLNRLMLQAIPLAVLVTVEAVHALVVPHEDVQARDEGRRRPSSLASAPHDLTVP